MVSLVILRRTVNKTLEKGKGSEDTSSIEKKSSIEEGGYVYLASIGT